MIFENHFFKTDTIPQCFQRKCLNHERLRDDQCILGLVRQTPCPTFPANSMLGFNRPAKSMPVAGFPSGKIHAGRPEKFPPEKEEPQTRPARAARNGSANPAGQCSGPSKLTFQGNCSKVPRTVPVHPSPLVRGPSCGITSRGSRIQN